MRIHSYPAGIRQDMSGFLAWLLKEVEEWLDERIAKRDTLSPADTSF